MCVPHKMITVDELAALPGASGGGASTQSRYVAVDRTGWDAVSTPAMPLNELTSQQACCIAAAHSFSHA
jgi:hypothetical protein